MSVDQLYECFKHFEANGWPQARPHVSKPKPRVRKSASELGVRRPSHSRATKAGFHTGRKPGNAGRKWPAEVLTPVEISLILNGCSATASTGIRNRAIFTTLYRSGLRIAECLALWPKDVSEDGAVTVLCGKGGKRRVTGMDLEALKWVRVWEERRAELGLDDRHRLFTSLHGTPLYASYVQSTLKRIARGAGITKRVHPHGLRHTFAFELASEGATLLDIQQLLGHSSAATTAHYINHLNPAAALATVRARSWTP